ncbi:MAG: hypothetical protein AAGJ80_08840 [Cyanobacteria bacterium J06553_1]
MVSARKTTEKLNAKEGCMKGNSWRERAIAFLVWRDVRSPNSTYSAKLT